MPDTPEKFYLTTPIYYVNARPHIGHAYSTIAADVIARRHRLLGDDTFFLTGTDEHGQKVQRSAAAAGIPPQQFADEVSATFRTLWARMGITNDDFIRTTDPRHKRGVQKLWSELQSRGAIYLSSYTGQYSVGEEMFIEGPPGTLGPDGKPTETVTEENYFFRLSDYQLPLLNLIESGQLHIQPEAVRNEVLSFLRGNVQAASTTNLSFRPEAAHSAAAVEKPANPSDTELPTTTAGTPYLPGALKDLSISRTTFTWGVPVPGDEKHVIYVWLDALANYLTAVGYGSDDPADQATFAKYWPANLHLVGKEITRFHCVYWPAFLMAAGLRLPKAVVANGWLLFEDSKMSKSRGNVVRTETILDAFRPLCPPRPPSSPLLSSRSEAEGSAFVVPTPPTKAEQDLFASDVIRYFLLREIPFGQDGSFSFDALITRYNADLANGYGNLVSRTLSMIGEVPCPLNRAEGDLPAVAQNHLFNLTSGPGKWAFTDAADKKNFRLGYLAGSIEHSIDLCYERTDLTGATEILTWAISAIDRHLSDNTPWKLPAGAERDDVIYTAAESIRLITALLYPILPYATASVWRQLGLGDIEAAARDGELKYLKWGGLQPGTKLGPLAPIFPRADKGLAQIMTDMESANTPAPAPTASVKSVSLVLSTPPEPAPTDPAAGPRTATLPIANPGATVAGSHALTTERPGTPSHTEAPASGIFALASQPATDNPQPATITIDDFVKIDLRVAQIVVAERIPKADKLLRLEVDLGPNFNPSRRQILSGIAEWYTPEELIGRRIAVIANLAPRKMRGLESHGMLLAASGEDHASKPSLATFSDEIPLGSRIR